MGRILGSENQGRLTVMLSGAFALSYMAGLIAFSGYSDQSGMTLKSLITAFCACVVWLMLWMMIMDSPNPGKGFLTRLFNQGRIVELAGIAFLLVVWVAAAFSMMHWNDEVSNLKTAEYIHRHGFGEYFSNYSEVNDWLGPHHPPLLPLVYAGIYTLFGPHIIAGRLFGISCSLLAVALAYLWMKRQVGRNLALAASALCLSFPLVWFNGASSILDPPFWLMFTASLLLFDRYAASQKAVDGLWCGLCVGAAILSRYNGFLLPPILLISLLVDAQGRKSLKKAGAWIVLFAPFFLLAPWFLYAAWTGSLFDQIRRIAGFILVAMVPKGGAFYIKTILLPLLPFMVGLWNIPIWAGSVFHIFKKDRDAGSIRVALVGILYVAFLCLTLPNPRYLLAVAPSLAFLSAAAVMQVENREKRGLSLLIFLLGLSFIHVALVIHQTSIGEVYFFY